MGDVMAIRDWDAVERIITRVYVDGSLVTESMQRADPSDLREGVRVMAEAARITDAAEADGLPYCVEVEDPDGPPGMRYARWGTDKRRMDEPVSWPLSPGTWFDGFTPEDFRGMAPW